MGRERERDGSVEVLDRKKGERDEKGEREREREDRVREKKCVD